MKFYESFTIESGAEFCADSGAPIYAGELCHESHGGDCYASAAAAQRAGAAYWVREFTGSNGAELRRVYPDVFRAVRGDL